MPDIMTLVAMAKQTKGPDGNNAWVLPDGELSEDFSIAVKRWRAFLLDMERSCGEHRHRGLYR